MRFKLVLFLVWIVTTAQAKTDSFLLVSNGKACPVVLASPTNPVRQAASMLTGDVQAVSGVTPQVSEDLTLLKKEAFAVLAGIPGINKQFDNLLKKHKIDPSSIMGVWEAYRIQTVSSGNKKIVLVMGSNTLGTVYGLLEISRLIGVSPWIWWADATPEHRNEVTLPGNFFKEDKPAVQFRGIFLNDEEDRKSVV